MLNIKHSERFGGTPKIVNNLNGENIRTPLNTDTTFTVRTDGSGDYINIFVALADLSDNYEINNIVTLDLDSGGDVIITADMPMFLGKGSLVIEGNNSTLQFYEAPGVSTLTIQNYTAVDIKFQNLTLGQGTATTAQLTITGNLIEFENVDFGTYRCTLNGGRAIKFTNCKTNSGFVKMYRSNEVYVSNCNPFTMEAYYCVGLTLYSNKFTGAFIVENCIFEYNNNRMNYNWWITTNQIKNCTVKFAGWFTAENLGGSSSNKDLIRLQACTISSMPNNIDIQGGARTFDNCSIMRLVNCTTPEDLTAVNYNFSAFTFQNGAAPISLINTSFIGEINITGGSVYADKFSIYNGEDFDPSGTTLTSTTKSEAIIELYNLIQTP